MSRRLRPSLIDDLVIGINPALIMVLIGSLIYFLLELFYQGQYPGRLHYCLSFFVMGAVLIARISMESGREHAAPFGLALAVVVALSLHRFVSYEGTPLAEVGWLINYALMGLIWWCADRLTWDCTLVDESQDASGEGLLQTVGLERLASDNGGDSQATAKWNDPASRYSDSSQGSPASPTFAPDASGKSWWQRSVERRRRPHAPGVWIVYFSLAALPLFGVGQLFIPVTNTASRRYAFVLLCVYVASGLGLLLTTSFLGLRRYLRQRRLEMPSQMTGVWLSTGAALIGVILFLAALLPRPNAEYAISQLPLGAQSAGRGSSRQSLGSEGTRDQKAKTGSGTQAKLKQPPTNTPGKQPSSKGPPKPGPGKSGDPSSRGSSEAQQQGEDADSSSNQGAEGSKAKGQNKNQQSQSKGNTEKTTESRTSSSPESSTRIPTQWVSLSLFKWIFYGVLSLAIAWWSWRHRAALRSWLEGLLSDWRSFWRQFTKSQATEEPTVVAEVKPKSFAEYPDPFATGIAVRHSPEELVQYSFEAFEAWARDSGWTRGADQTAYEFVRQVAARAEHLAAPGRTLATLYSQAAYAPGSLPPSSVDQVRSFWNAIARKPWAE